MLELGSRLGILVGFRPLSIAGEEESSRTSCPVATAIPALPHGRRVNEVAILQAKYSRDILFEDIPRCGQIAFTMLCLIPFLPGRIQQIRQRSKHLLPKSESIANILSGCRDPPPQRCANSRYPLILQRLKPNLMQKRLVPASFPSIGLCSKNTHLALQSKRASASRSAVRRRHGTC